MKRIFIATVLLSFIGLALSMNTKPKSEKAYVKCTVMQFQDGHVEMLFDDNVKYLGENYHQLVLSDYNGHCFPSGLDAVGHLTARWGWKQVGNGYSKDNKLCWDLTHEVEKSITTYKRDIEIMSKKFPQINKRGK